MTDEPIFWAHLMAKRGLTDVGLLVEQSLIGETYTQNFRKAARRRGLRIVAEAPIAQTAQDVTESVGILHEAKASAILHCGFGFGVVMVNPALAALNYDVARTLLEAIVDAHPLSPRGIKEALERVKMIPAASGAPGTRISFGKWKRQAWVGAGYLVARQFVADGVNSHLVDRFGGG